jgi:hypothetical protein
VAVPFRGAMAAVHPARAPFAERRPSGPKPALARLDAAAAQGLPAGGREAERSPSPAARRNSYPPSRRGSAASSSAAGDAAWRRRSWAAALDGAPAQTAHLACLAVALFASDACELLRLPDRGAPRAALDAALLLVAALWAAEWAARCACVPQYARSLACATDAAAAASVCAGLSWLRPGAALARAARAAPLVRAARLARALHAAQAALAARRAAAAAGALSHAPPRHPAHFAPTAIAATVSEDVTHKARGRGAARGIAPDAQRSARSAACSARAREQSRADRAVPLARSWRSYWS